MNDGEVVPGKVPECSAVFDRPGVEVVVCLECENGSSWWLRHTGRLRFFCFSKDRLNAHIWVDWGSGCSHSLRGMSAAIV